MTDESPSDLLNLTADVVGAYVTNNSISADDIPRLIAGVHQALSGLGSVGEADTSAQTYEPAVSVRKSLADPDRIVSLIDGKPYASLKRHLSSQGLTPEDYRARYNLPPSYPMVAPGYSEKRRMLAKAIGLGRKPATEVAPKPETKPARKRVRKPKA